MNALLDSDPIMIVTLFANAAMILSTVLFCIFLQKRTAASMGFVRKKAFTQYLAGAGTGLLLFCGAVLINVLTGSMTIDGISSGFSPVLFLLFLLGFGVQGMGEEVLCRGYFMVSLGRRYRAAAAVFLNSAVFSLLHIFNPGISLLAIVNLLLAGVVFSLYFLRTGNIWGAGAMHTVWNFVQGNVFGMEVSGLEISCSLFSSTSDPSRSLWNGGSFGAEGGHVEMRQFLPVQKMQEITAEKDAEHAQAGKDDGKRQADLPHQLKGLVRVIPHCPAHYFIYKDPGDKLARCDKDHAPAHLLPERRVPPGPHPLLGEKNKAEPAEQEHGPVGKSPEYHFKCIIQGPAERSQK